MSYLKDYLKKEFNFGIYSILSVFLILAIFINYSYDFESKIIDKSYGSIGHFFVNVLYYAIPYLIACLVISIKTKEFSYWLKIRFYVVLGIFVTALSFDSYYHWYDLWAGPSETAYYWRKINLKITRTLFYILPLLIYYLIRYKAKGSFFGLTTKGFNYKPYFVMALFMTPLLIWASYDASFLKAYPTYNPGRAEVYWNISVWTSFIPYEFLYALTFVALEILFRGFLIYEMEEFLGNKVVIPMVCVYCTLHFGKPMFETISSIFGGFLLGVIALKSRSIFGGVWIHIFIALGMDFLALLQKEFLMKW